jgi:hypothetical protein
MRSKTRVADAKQTDANREFKSQQLTGWQWFVMALIAFTIIDRFVLGVL